MGLYNEMAAININMTKVVFYEIRQVLLNNITTLHRNCWSNE
jgi:hypothetical protein